VTWQTAHLPRVSPDIRTRPVTYNLGVDLHTTPTRMLEFFEDHDTGAFTNDEASTITVEWTRGLLGFVVEGGGKAAGACESADGERMDAGFGAAGYHDVCVPVCDETSGVADGVGAGGAGRCCGVIGALG
jgi:hypothetical protein